MERDDRALATFFVAAAPRRDQPAMLEGAAAHHVRVRRLGVGDRVRVADGRGTIGTGAIEVVRKIAVEVLIDRTWTVAPLPALHLLVPVGDRDRMLWLAEKATELGISSWQAVRFHRSASVGQRGEGRAFMDKVRARMIGALEQSGGAWLPEIRPDVSMQELRTNRGGLQLLLDVAGEPILSFAALASQQAVEAAFGPEGGLETREVALLTSAGWRKASLGPATLRFETAGIAACAIARAMTHRKDSQ